MSVRNDRTLSVEKLGIAVSNLVDAATEQQDICEKLLDQLRAATIELRTATTELTHNMPNKIAQQAAQGVVQKITD